MPLTKPQMPRPFSLYRVSVVGHRVPHPYMQTDGGRTGSEPVEDMDSHSSVWTRGQPSQLKMPQGMLLHLRVLHLISDFSNVL